MYFSKFKKGLYDINNTGNKKLVTDIMTRVNVKAKIIDVVSL